MTIYVLIVKILYFLKFIEKSAWLLLAKWYNTKAVWNDSTSRTSCSSPSKKVEKTWKKFLTNESTYGIMYKSPIQSDKRNRDISTRTLKIKQRWKGTRLIKSLETPGTRVPKTVITYRFERTGRTIKISSSRKGILIQSFKSLILAQDERWRRA